MKKTIIKKLISTLICSAVILCMNLAYVNACTTFGIDTQDGKHFQAMGLELYSNLNSKIAKMPRGQEFQAPAPEGMIGAKWTNQYGYVGMNSKDMKWVQGGMNEKGLTVATLYLPGTGYQVPIKADNGKILGAIELPGDETPVGRFVRTAFYAGSVSPRNAEEGLYETMNVLGKMKVIEGSMKYDGANFGEQGDIMNRTQWSWIANQSDKVYYATAYDSPEYFKVDLKTVDFGTKEMETYEFLGKELPVTNVTFK